MPRAARAAFAAALVAVLAVNLWSLAGNPPFQRAPDRLADAARTNSRASVRATFAVYYFVRSKLAGKKLQIPPTLNSHAWYLEHGAEVEISVAEASLEIEPARFRRLRRVSDYGTRMLVNGSARDIYFLLNPRRDEFVIARERGGSAMMVLPARLYRRIDERDDD